MTYSPVTLEPLPTPEQIFKDMVQLYRDEKGYGDLFDAYKVLLPIKPDEIGIKLFEEIDSVNEAEMKAHGRCSDCGTPLKPTSAHTAECPECQQEFREVG